MSKNIFSNVEKAEGPADRYVCPYYKEPIIWTCRSTGKTTRGFSSLSDDLLVYVFRFVSVSALEWSAALYLSWVCRRFRNAALRLPHLWALVTIDMWYSIDIVNLYIERSRGVGLTVVLGNYEAGASVEEFFIMITRPSVLARWEKLVATLPPYNHPLRNFVIGMARNPNINWPRLQSLDMTYIGDDMGVGVLLNKLQVDFPQVRSISLDSSGFAPSRLPSSVTHLRFTYDSARLASLECLWRMLEDSPNLKVAEITLFNLGWQYVPIARFSSLVVLRVHVTMEQNSDTSPFWRMHFPKLTDLHISLHDCHECPEMAFWDRMFACTNGIFTKCNEFPSLRRLSLDFGECSPEGRSYRDDPLPVAFPGSLLKVCPALEVLDIYCGGDFEVFDLPPLRSLRLRGVDLKCTKWMFQYLDSLNQRGMWHVLEEFVLLGCSFPAEEDITRLREYGSKICFVDFPDDNDRWRQKFEIPLRTVLPYQR